MQITLTKTLRTLTTLLIVFLVWIGCNMATSFKNKQQERLYEFKVPERLSLQTVLLLQGHAEQVSAKDEREINLYITNEYLTQSRQYFVIDSTKAANEKNKKPVKP